MIHGFYAGEHDAQTGDVVQAGRALRVLRQAAAEQYVAEALAEETGLTVDSVTLTQSGGECAALTVQLTAGDTALTAEVALR